MSTLINVEIVKLHDKKKRSTGVLSTVHYVHACIVLTRLNTSLKFSLVFESKFSNNAKIRNGEEYKTGRKKIWRTYRETKRHGQR